MKKIIVTIIVLIGLKGFAQKADKDKLPKLSKESAFLGGSFTLPILSLLQGQKDVMISLNPHFGYKIKSNLDVALVLNFQRNKFDNTPENYSNIFTTGAVAKVNMLGFGGFARFFPIDFAYLQLQPELNMITKKETKYSFNTNNFTVTNTELGKTTTIKPSLLIGGGYKQGLNRGNSFFYASIFYDLIAKNSPYSNGIIQTATNSNNSTPIFFRGGINIMLADLKRNR